MEQELFTLPEHLSSPPIFNGVRITRSLVLYVCFVDGFFLEGASFQGSDCSMCSIDHCLYFCQFSFGQLLCLFFDLRLLVTSLVYSNFSWRKYLIYHAINCFFVYCKQSHRREINYWFVLKQDTDILAPRT